MTADRRAAAAVHAAVRRAAGELSVGLLVGRVERRAAWRLLGFLPAFALSIWITTRAYVDGMLDRPYTWVKTTRSGATSTVRPDAAEPVAGGSTPRGGD